MIRILYITDSLMAGGIESQLVELVTHLDRTRFSPAIFCLYGPTARALHFAPQIHAANIPLFTPDLGWTSWAKISAVARIVSTVRSLRPHLIQAEGYHANLLARLARPFFPPVTLIGSVRGTHTTKQLFYEWLSHRACTRLVVNAPHLKTMLATRAHLPADKVVHIPNGIHIQRFSQPYEGELRQQIAPNARRVLITLGRISFEKSIHLTVAGLGVLKRRGRLPGDMRLVIAGPVQEEAARQALEAAIRQDALESQVILHPGTAHPEDYYHACDVCVVYSPDRTPGEGLPSVILEALAAGRPVLASEVANAAQVIEEGVTGWVVRANDPQHLADALERILGLPDAAFIQMQKACLQAAQGYAAEHMVRHYTSLYCELASAACAQRGKDTMRAAR